MEMEMAAGVQEGKEHACKVSIVWSRRREPPLRESSGKTQTSNWKLCVDVDVPRHG
jgi:hypothetical protein